MWKIAQCAVPGKSHMKANIPCQDKTSVFIKNGVTVVALADGAGSASLSHYGAEFIAKFICEDIADNFIHYIKTVDGRMVKLDIMKKVKQSLCDLSIEHHCDINDLASTLLSVAEKDGEFILIHIGDGLIGCVQNNEVKVLSRPENKDFANVTVFSTSLDAVSTMKLVKGRIDDISGFVLMSDGTEASLYDKRRRTLPDVIIRLLDYCRIMPTNEFEKQLTDSFWETVREATTDDCSIILVANDSKSYQYLNWSLEKQARFWNVSVNKSKKTLKTYNRILKAITIQRDLNAISRIVYIKPKYLKRHLNALLEKNMIEKKGFLYKSLI